MAIEQARLVYRKYIARNSPLELNLSSLTLRMTIDKLVGTTVIKVEEYPVRKIAF